MKIQKNKIYVLVDGSDKGEAESLSDIYNFFGDEIIRGKQVDKAVWDKLKANDVLVVENVLSLGSSLSEILEALAVCAEHRVHLCLARENISFKADKLPEIADSLLLAWRLHQSLISLRSKTALQERKEQGVKLGRPYGSNPALKLDDHKDEIKKLLLTGVSKDDIAEQYNVCRATVYNFVKKNPELLLRE